MARPIAYGVNLLETSTVSVTGEAAGKGKERLTDREIVLPYQDSGITTPRRLTADQGAGVSTPWDTWIVPPGHNLNGLTLQAETSPDMASWTERDSFVPGSTGLILRTPGGGPFSFRGMRLTINSPASPPSLGELLFTTKYELPVGPSIGGLEAGHVSGVTRAESAGGYVWKVRHWGPLWSARYRLDDLTVAQRDTLLTLFETLASGAKPFYLTDHDGTTRWVEWMNPEALFQAAPVSLHGVELAFREVK
jgi:hypothetical protein